VGVDNEIVVEYSNAARAMVFRVVNAQVPPTMNVEGPNCVKDGNTCRDWDIGSSDNHNILARNGGSMNKSL